MLLWDASTKSPKSSFDWNTNSDINDASIVCAKFNPVETELFGEFLFNTSYMNVYQQIIY